MSVERNKDGSISIQSKNVASVIFGMVGVSDDKRKEKFEQWVDECAKLITACGHTLKETEQYSNNAILKYVGYYNFLAT